MTFCYDLLLRSFAKTFCLDICVSETWPYPWSRPASLMDRSLGRNFATSNKHDLWSIAKGPGRGGATLQPTLPRWGWPRQKQPVPLTTLSAVVKLGRTRRNLVPETRKFYLRSSRGPDMLPVLAGMLKKVETSSAFSVCHMQYGTVWSSCSGAMSKWQIAPMRVRGGGLRPHVPHYSDDSWRDTFFREAWTRQRSVTSDMRCLRKHLLTYLRSFLATQIYIV